MSTIPEKMLAWPMFGTGFEFFGKDDKPCVVPVPEIKEDELLVRIDAIGLCFSDVMTMSFSAPDFLYDSLIVVI